MRLEIQTATVLSVAVLLLATGCGSDPTPASSTSAPPSEPAPPPEPEPEPPTEPQPEPPAEPECEDSFDSTYDAIQEVVFERRGCTASSCHGDAASGGLDLRADVSYDNLVDAPSVGSLFDLVEPTKVTESYLFQKLAAATNPVFQSSDIAGAPMPLAGPAVSDDELEAIRLWIESAAPRTGAIGDEFGGNRVAELLDACLPDPEPVVIEPLEPPPPGEGIQLSLPPHSIPAGGEFEICFAEYLDFRDQIDPRFLAPDGNTAYANSVKVLAEPNTHHMTFSYSGLGPDDVHAPEFGRWECADGPRAGEDCDPLDRSTCDGHSCRSEIKRAIACIGYGPPGAGDFIRSGSPVLRAERAQGREGYFSEFPTNGIFFWNSHAFNLSTEDLLHHHYTNIYLTDDRQFEVDQYRDSSGIFMAAGTPPFTRREICRENVVPQGTVIAMLTSHTHKRGELFTMTLKSTGEEIYRNAFWDDPVRQNYDPPLVFDGDDPDSRTIVYCAVYNNGLTRNDEFDVGLVTRLSRRPPGTSCKPIACAEGLVGEPCDGADDHATCDTSPGAGDGMCDACAITPGTTSDDEMFIMNGAVIIPVDE